MAAAPLHSVPFSQEQIAHPFEKALFQVTTVDAVEVGQVAILILLASLYNRAKRRADLEPGCAAPSPAP